MGSGLTDAEAALGQLAGLGAVITDPAILIGPCATREAIASSRIEGTQASLSDVLQAEITTEDAPSRDVREVNAHLRATRLANELSNDLPVLEAPMDYSANHVD